MSFRHAAVAVLAYSLLSPSEASAKFFLITHGDTIKHLGTAADGHTEVGYKYSYGGVFWIDFWTWDGTYCTYVGERYNPISAEEAARLLGKSPGDMGKPLLFRYPLGLLVLGGFVILAIIVAIVDSAWQFASWRRAARSVRRPSRKQESWQPPPPLEGEVAATQRAAVGGGAPHPVAHVPGSPRSSRRRLTLLTAVVVTLGLVALALWLFVFREATPKNDFERFQGTWQVSIGDRITPIIVRVTGDRWDWGATGNEGRAYKLTLNETVNPKEIDLDPIDVAGIRGRLPKLHGIYAFDGSTARVRVNDTTEPRPTSFDDPNIPVWTLTKVKVETEAK